MTVANVHRGKGQRPFEVRDFLPDPGPRPRQAWRQQLETVRMLNAAFGGTTKKDT